MTDMLIRNALFTLFAAFCAVAPMMPAKAQQSTLPGFEISATGAPNLEASTVVDTSPDAAFSAIRNHEMQSVLRLQNQIMMIQALTNWQSKISKLEETYAKAGLPFTPPQPPRAICDQVPPNSVCGDAYSDLAPPASVSAKMAKDLPAPEPMMPAAPKEAKKDLPPPPVEEKAPTASYRWADIRCMANACSAVLINDENNTRVSTIEGETLDDNVLVQQISPLGVTLRIDGKAVELLPSDAPAQKFASEAKAAPAAPQDNNKQGLSNALKAVPSGPGDSPAPVAGAPLIDDAGSPIVLDDGEGNVDKSPVTAPPVTTTTTTTTTTTPADNDSLGPTGLF